MVNYEARNKGEEATRTEEYCAGGRAQPIGLILLGCVACFTVHRFLVGVQSPFRLDTHRCGSYWASAVAKGRNLHPTGWAHADAVTSPLHLATPSSTARPRWLTVGR